MKQFLLLLITGLTVTTGFSQALFTYGSNEVNKEEFLRAYNKNKTEVIDKEKSLREYLDLYSKFKLKVKAAKESKLDTLDQLKYDVQNFRSQVEESYLHDENAVNFLVDEAFQRSQKDIHLLHFYITINNKMAPADTLKARKAINELREELLKGKMSYDEIVDEISEEIMPVKGKDLGFVTAFSIPYEIENLIYNLKPGAVSRVFRTKSALHVFKNSEERKSAGKWKIAQILFAIPPDVTGPKLKEIENLADSVYGLLKAGANFSELVKKYSDDRITYLNGGEMPEFGTGKYELPFEKAVFALEKDSDFSKPIFTGFGFHIIKRLSQQPTPADKKDDAFMASLKQQVLQDSRVNIAKDVFMKRVMLQTGFKKNSAIKEAQLYSLADSVTVNKTVGNFPVNKSTIFSFSKLNVTVSDWLNFVKDYKLNADVYKGEDNKALMEKYINTTAMEYYRKNLETYNDDFKYQMQEFKEGNMLFEIMERNVWSKAANDNEGLKKFYAANKSNYLWGESATVYLFNCNNLKIAEAAIDSLKLGANWKRMADNSEGNIQADSARYELAQLQLPEGTVAKEGLISVPTSHSGDNTVSFIKILKIFPAAQQRSFEEARGLVINDYQNYLEQKWMEELKMKYPIKINEAVFKSIIK